MTTLAAREVDVSIAAPFQDALSQEWLQAVVDRALQVALLPEEPGQVSLVIVDDAEIRGLNRRFRGLDEVTDVLSFSTSHQGHWEGEEDLPAGDVPDNTAGQDPDDNRFIFPTEVVPPLGEVIVSYPQALRQTQAQNGSLEREIALLIVHGVLHLVGHDHLDVEDTALMKAKEQAALEGLLPSGVNGP